MKILLFFGALLLAAWGCIEPYEPEVGAYDSVLVVDGLLSNHSGPATVILSRSFPYSEDTGVHVSNATVMIENEQGENILLEEISPGTYQSDSSRFQGKPGIKYRLLVRTPDDNEFESDWELLKVAPPIDQIKVEYKEILSNDPEGDPIPGAQFLVSTRDPENKTRYYRWEFEETYRYFLSYPPLIRVEFSDRPGNGQDQVFYNNGNNFEGYRCWKTEKSKQLIIATTEALSQDIIVDHPFLYVDNSTPRLSTKYSVLLKQYAITKNHYAYLKKIEEINETTGSLFDPIPNEVYGNIRSSDNSNIPVLGYFSVSGVTEKRIFLARSDLMERFAVPRGPECPSDTIELDFQLLKSKVRSPSIILYDYNYNLLGFPIGFVLSGPECTSCAASGAVNKAPDFWED